MNSKIMALIAAVCVFAGAFAVISADDSEAATAGQMNVYIYDGSEWTDYVGMPGYNALQALQATGETIVADTDYILEKENEWGPYTEINDNYGNVTSIDGVAENASKVWNVFVYNNGWSVGIDAIGFITPFSDGAAPSANVVLYYGEDTETVPTELINHMSGKTLADLIDPSGTNYLYTFDIKVTASGYEPTVAPIIVTYINGSGDIAMKLLTASDLMNGITLVGYGSNAYTALKDAVGYNNIDATESPGAYYGWLNELFGLTTASTGSNYVYWAQYSASGAYLLFNLGAYSTLENVPSDTDSSDEDFVQSAFILNYA